MTHGPRVSTAARVLDASALLAYLQRESGCEAVVLTGSAISTVNWSEVVQKAVQAGLDPEGLGDEVAAHGLRMIDLTARRAESVALLWARTRNAGLSLADRACLALAAELAVPAVTTDRAWLAVDVGVEVIVVREGRPTDDRVRRRAALVR